jgi:hypothetical protein
MYDLQHGMDRHQAYSFCGSQGLERFHERAGVVPHIQYGCQGRNGSFVILDPDGRVIAYSSLRTT